MWDAIVSGKTAKLAVYLPAQFLGAFAGAILVWLQYLPHWKETPDAGLKLHVSPPGRRSAMRRRICSAN
ncbi:MAG: hypothetical protein WDN28_10565 [Chthoniobacter sp.]